MGVGGPCGFFTPPVSYWCSDHPAAGGAPSACEPPPVSRPCPAPCPVAYRIQTPRARFSLFGGRSGGRTGCLRLRSTIGKRPAWGGGGCSAESRRPRPACRMLGCAARLNLGVWGVGVGEAVRQVLRYQVLSPHISYTSHTYIWTQLGCVRICHAPCITHHSMLNGQWQTVV